MEKILYADDEDDIREIIQNILSKENYEVILARDGNEALKLAKEKNPDLIVLDYLMPGLTGDQVCEALKKDTQTQHIPIIIITAYLNEKEKSLSAGAIDFINKPIERTDLLLRIKAVLKVRNIKNELQKLIAYIEELER